MKKLKTWQIVLLVIFYPVGICVLIYRLWKKNELKKEAAEADRLRAEEKARKEAEREEARRREEAYRATVNREIFRVVGEPRRPEPSNDTPGNQKRRAAPVPLLPQKIRVRGQACRRRVLR